MREAKVSKRVRVLAMGIEANGLESLAAAGVLLARRYTVDEITRASVLARELRKERAPAIDLSFLDAALAVDAPRA